MITVRHAEMRDIPAIERLLGEVLEIHAGLRPDLFISGTTKYTRDELEAILKNEKTPVFVAADETNRVAGYVFCVLQDAPKSTNMRKVRSVYIDDLCVDESARGQHVGRALLDFVKAYAKEHGFYAVTLHVWEGNDRARAFYEKNGMKVKETTMEYVV
ncbi:MAG: GNAT family N-acetyltransferase [Lachnospiraceae bacterium]|nr:GNAT family N-acetyltransferase [Lachnospiraceae bacterium]MCH4064320.1 GNAT family N-acetyltransferase [Lachnospiraceae bacterium]MCH4102955.1 GNAT family N-acetyltransferase [Lachnospiraceae bacterium]MCI1308944.1 GNAT family N-acetyltransferase [Lachnospiraceae bacterium]MCI1333426.1 GNAT family N-acetyltransferase [Lachnospiraceae bacterium]